MEKFCETMLSCTTTSRLLRIATIMTVMVSGCSQVPVAYTISTGSHVHLTDEELAERQKNPSRRYVVWGNHQAATNSAIQVIQRAGKSVVERARLRTIFDEQKIILTHSSDDDATLLKVGELVGADVVVFVETTERAESFTPSTSTMQNLALRLEAADAIGKGRDPLWMKMQNQQQQIRAYRPGVTARAVRVETGEIVWSGSSILSQGVSDPELAYPGLAEAAILRAVCPIERGAKWVEGASDGSRQPWGCIE